MNDAGQERWQFWGLTGVAILTFALAAFNILMAQYSRAIQTDVNARQHYINQSFALSNVNQQVVTAVATLAARTNDEQLRNLLAEHGITFRATGQQGPTKGQP